MSGSLLDDAMASEPETRESCETEESGDSSVMTYYGSKIETVDQLLEHAKVDLNIWEVESATVNNWEISGKRRVAGPDGSRESDRLWKTGNRQIKVKLRRRAPKFIQDGLAGILANWKPRQPKPPPKRPTKNLHLFEVGLYDHHFGKLCWGAETGTNYDMTIARDEFAAAVDGMLSHTSGYGIEKILLPIGNDLFHSNDWSSQTANGTRVDSVDTRYSKVFETVYDSVEYAIRQCLTVAPVELIWVPGNHDRNISWTLLFAIKMAYRDFRHVSIDDGPRFRKYRSYGPCLHGYTHGDEAREKDWVNLMATEVPDLWAKAKFRSWRTGHFHKRKETRYTAGDTFNGVEVRVFPSLCGTDHWHYRQGYTGSCRMAECHIFSRDEGPVGHFLVHAKQAAVPA